MCCVCHVCEGDYSIFRRKKKKSVRHESKTQKQKMKDKKNMSPQEELLLVAGGFWLLQGTPRQQIIVIELSPTLFFWAVSARTDQNEHLFQFDV